ncbi:hypothetical protein TI04_05240 [Achromatium sp. WMS2]|nr:hypothetical protein TI04_05240 [Achromatium sp. WMS2]
MAIRHFRGEYAFLSNFAESMIVVDGLIWGTVEHAFQAAKMLDEANKERIRGAPYPRLAKYLGRTLSPRRTDWEQCKEDIMHQMVTLKFKQNEHLLAKLLSTGTEELVEGNNWHDNIWGDCECPECQNIPGQNLLGKVIMRVRSELTPNQ